jgi:uncharacterized membrane protein YfcA
MVPITSAGALVYYFGKSTPELDVKVALFVVLGSAVGAVVGANLSRIAPERALRMLVAGLLVVGSAKELHDAVIGGSAVLQGTAGGELGMSYYLLISLAGLVIGTLSGLVGVGGGILLVPALILFFAIGQRVAQGTSLLATLPTAAVGASIHFRQGSVDLGAAGRMALAGVPGVLLGAVLALWLPQRVLAALFGMLLALIAVRLWPRREQPATN